MLDVVHAHLEGSDPLVVSQMKFKRKKSTPLTAAMRALLYVDPTATTDALPDEDSDDESDAEWTPEDN